MAFLSQTLGEMKHVNGISNQNLRNLVSVDHQDWADNLGQVDFSHNVTMHLGTKWTKGTSFVMAYGVRSNLLT